MSFADKIKGKLASNTNTLIKGKVQNKTQQALLKNTSQLIRAPESKSQQKTFLKNTLQSKISQKVQHSNLILEKQVPVIASLNKDLQIQEVLRYDNDQLQSLRSQINQLIKQNSQIRNKMLQYDQQNKKSLSQIGTYKLQLQQKQKDSLAKINQLQNKIKQIQKQKKDTIESEKNKYKALQTQLNSQKSRYTQLQKSLDTTKKQLQGQINTQKTKYSQLQTSMTTLKSQLQSQISSEKKKISQLQSQYNSEMSKYSQLQSQFNSEKSKYSQLQSQFNSEKSKYSQLQGQFNSEKSKYSQLQGQYNSKIQEQLKEGKNKMEQLQNKLRNQQALSAQRLSSLEDQKKLITQKQKQLENLKQQHINTKGNLQSQIQNLKGKLNELNKQIANNPQIASLNKSLSDITTQKKKYEKQIQDLKKRQTDRNQLQTKLTEIQSKLKRIESQKSILEQKVILVDELQNQKEKLQQQIKGFKAAAMDNKTQQQLYQVKQLLKNYQNSINVLTQEKKNLQNQKAEQQSFYTDKLNELNKQLQGLNQKHKEQAKIDISNIQKKIQYQKEEFESQIEEKEYQIQQYKRKSQCLSRQLQQSLNQMTIIRQKSEIQKQRLRLEFLKGNDLTQIEQEQQNYFQDQMTLWQWLLSYNFPNLHKIENNFLKNDRTKYKQFPALRRLVELLQEHFGVKFNNLQSYQKLLTYKQQLNKIKLQAQMNQNGQPSINLQGGGGNGVNQGGQAQQQQAGGGGAGGQGGNQKLDPYTPGNFSRYAVVRQKQEKQIVQLIKSTIKQALISHLKKLKQLDDYQKRKKQQAKTIETKLANIFGGDKQVLYNFLENPVDTFIARCPLVNVLAWMKSFISLIDYLSQYSIVDGQIFSWQNFDFSKKISDDKFYYVPIRYHQGSYAVIDKSKQQQIMVTFLKQGVFQTKQKMKQVSQQDQKRILAMVQQYLIAKQIKFQSRKVSQMINQMIALQAP